MTPVPELDKCILYGRKVCPGIKFGDLAVGIETAKLKSANIIFYVRNA